MLKIIYARMAGYDWVSTPSDAVARELENLGHRITIVEDPHILPCLKHDFVWSPYESVTLLGDTVSKTLNIPHFSHIEVLPPWRVIKDCDYYNYGIEANDPELANISQTKPYYLTVGKAWKEAAISTISSPCRINMHEKLLNGLPSNLHLRFPSIDLYTAKKAKKIFNFIKRKPNTILTIGRAVPCKRYDLLLNVINNVQSKATWVVVGDGPKLSQIQNEMKNPNIDLQILGPQWGWNKYLLMLSSSILFVGPGGMPSIEAALMGCFPIVMENQPTQDVPQYDMFMEYNIGNSAPIFKHNEIEKTTNCIDTYINNNKTGLQKYETVNKFLTGKTGVTSSKTNAENIVKLMQKVLNE